MNRMLVKYEAAGVVDAVGVEAAPGAILVEHNGAHDPKPFGCRVLAVGAPEAVGRHPLAPGPGAGAAVVALPDSVLIPGLVNAHAHLDLTHIGPRARRPGEGFVEWIEMIRRERRTDEAGIRDSVRQGVEQSLTGGVVAVGDIAGADGLVALDELRASPLIGVSFVEFFGLGERAGITADRMRALIREAAIDDRGVRLGLQPHAPYSAGRVVYATAAALNHERGVPIATHVAETPEERALVERGEGPLREFLDRLGLWDDATAREFGRGARPIALVATALGQTRFLAAHANDATEEEIDLLSARGASVAFCPRAHEYFGHFSTIGPHRYRDMLSRGVTVALGTDSVVCLTGAGEPPALSTLHEARLLWRRDRVDARSLIAMCTINSAAALGLDPGLFRLAPGRVAGIAAVEVDRETAARPPAERVMSASGAIRLLSAGR